MQSPTDSKGSKHDGGKPRLELISPTLLQGLASVLTFGARKYAAHNWRKGLEFGRVFGALQRHLWAFWQGEDLDPESGLHHLDHAACELMFLREFAATRPDLDDRWRPSEQTAAPLPDCDRSRSRSESAVSVATDF